MKNTLSIRIKIIIPLIVLTPLAGIVGTFGIYNHFYSSLLSQLELRAESYADSIRRAIEISGQSHNIDRILHAYGENQDISNIVLAAHTPLIIIASTQNKYVGQNAETLNKPHITKRLGEVITNKTE